MGCRPTYLLHASGLDIFNGIDDRIVTQGELDMVQIARMHVARHWCRRTADQRDTKQSSAEQQPASSQSQKREQCSQSVLSREAAEHVPCAFPLCRVDTRLDKTANMRRD